MWIGVVFVYTVCMCVWGGGCDGLWLFIVSMTFFASFYNKLFYYENFVCVNILANVPTKKTSKPTKKHMEKYDSGLLQRFLCTVLTLKFIYELLF